jgi:hypothetical protein
LPARPHAARLVAAHGLATRAWGAWGGLGFSAHVRVRITRSARGRREVVPTPCTPAGRPNPLLSNGSSDMGSGQPTPVNPPATPGTSGSRRPAGSGHPSSPVSLNLTSPACRVCGIRLRRVPKAWRSVTKPLLTTGSAGRDLPMSAVRIAVGLLGRRYSGSSTGARPGRVETHGWFAESADQLLARPGSRSPTARCVRAAARPVMVVVAGRGRRLPTSVVGVCRPGIDLVISETGAVLRPYHGARDVSSRGPGFYLPSNSPRRPAGDSPGPTARSTWSASTCSEVGQRRASRPDGEVLARLRPDTLGRDGSSAGA